VRIDQLNEQQILLKAGAGDQAGDLGGHLIRVALFARRGQARSKVNLILPHAAAGLIHRMPTSLD
jgi:hypothetical protein